MSAKRVVLWGGVVIVAIVSLFAYDMHMREQAYRQRIVLLPHVLEVQECTYAIVCDSFGWTSKLPIVRVGNLFGRDPFISREMCDAAAQEVIAQRIQSHGTSPLTRFTYDCFPVEPAIEVGR